jgi:spoIIIJ-associated protein
MSLEKKDFYGKEVAAAIKSACDTLGVSQEKLDIEVVETGTTGIFGLIRKKAHIRVQVKPDLEEVVADIFEADTFLKSVSEDQIDSEPVVSAPPAPPAAPAPSKEKEVVTSDKVQKKRVAPLKEEIDDDDEDDLPMEGEPESAASPESLEIIRTELLQIVELMGFPSTLEMETVGRSVTCTLRGEHEDSLTSADGKVLDSLQYILRKIISRKVPERLRISINVADFREKRLEELKVRAVAMAAQVKEEGKTQVLPALNPSERRTIHMILQEDKEIRSRSVGDGLFKKILIYKPGKGSRSGGRKRPQTKGRQNKSGSKKKE